MNMKRIAAMAMASCMTLFLCSCGTQPDGIASGSAAQDSGAPTLEQIYAANTLSAYEEANIQVSLSTCLREGKEKKETNALLTIYQDDELGLVSRLRRTDMGFHYYFNKDGANFYCETDKEKNVSVTLLADNAEQATDDGMTYPELLFRKNSFGDYNSKEKIISCTDSGDTYHIVTDISASSFTDSAGRTYTYTTQEYDVEKETLRILDMFRTYHFIDRDGTDKECTLSRSMTYGKQVVGLPDFMQEHIKNASWDRRITVVSADGTKTVSVPDGVPVLVDAPDGYEAYTDSNHTQIYSADSASDSGKYPDRIIYLAEK